MKPLVTVVVPVYNVAPYLPDCIESLLAQTLQPMELIFVDDASTDNSLAVLQDYEARYPDRMRVIASAENHKQGGARNVGLRQAKADWVGWIDSDDFVTPDFYKTLYDRVQETGADVAFLQYAAVPHDAHPGTVDPAALTPLIRWDDWLLRWNGQDLTDEGRMDLICCPIGGLVCGLWRKSLLTDHDLWFPADVRYEDNYWGPIAKVYLQRAAFVPRVGYLYRQVAASTTHKRNQPYIRDRMTMERATLQKADELGLRDRYHDAWEYLYGWRYCVNTVQTYLRSYDEIPFDTIDALVDEVDAAFPHWQQNRYYCHLVPEAQRAENARQVYHTRQWVRDRDAAAQKQRRAEARARLWDKGCRTVKKLLHISTQP